MPATDYNAYMREYMGRRRAAFREEARWLLGGECVRCGEVEGLEFDHIDPATKTRTIADIIAKGSRDALMVELSKCQLLCRPCHIVKSRDEGSLGGGGGHNRVEVPQHGTSVMYHRESCRCDTCREWKRLYRAKTVDVLGLPVTPAC